MTGGHDEPGLPARHTELTFTGPATFFKAPYRSLASGVRSAQAPRVDIAILGVPYDFAVGYRPGARFAPAAIRAASCRYALPPSGYYDFAGDRHTLAGARLLDAGDVDPAQLDHQVSLARIGAAARTLREAARLPLFVGGDHSVSYPLLGAFDDVADLEVVQLDAHLDFSDERNGSRFSNSSPFRRAADDMARLGVITTLGLRGLRADAEAFAAARARGHRLISAAEIHADLASVMAQLPRDKDVYLSIDVDVFEPAELPGTSSPEPAGLSFAQVLTLVRAVIARNRLVAADLVELADHLDPSGRSALLAARLLGETMVAWWDSPAARQPNTASR